MRKHDNEAMKYVVLSLLESDERARDDDAYLYKLVLSKTNPGVLELDVNAFLNTVNARDDIPSIECVGRMRRLWQEKQPELGPSKHCKRKRSKLENEYHDFYAYA